MPAPRRTHAEVEKAHKEAVAIEAEASARQDKAVEKVAAIEDEQCRQDEAREHERKKERERKNAGTSISDYMRSYYVLNSSLKKKTKLVNASIRKNVNTRMLVCSLVAIYGHICS